MEGVSMFLPPKSKRSKGAESSTEDVECLALVDSRAQISTTTIEFVKHLGLKIHQIHRILKFETNRGGDVPYIGYVEANF